MQISDVIAELGEMVGIKFLCTNEHGVVHLTIDRIGDLFVDERFAGTEDHSVFVYLLRVYEFFSANLYERAMRLCDYRNNYSFIVNPVLRKDQALGFAIKFKAEEFNIQGLQQAIELLKDIQDKLENGAGE
ncbi:MAG: hypothetical protein LBF94_03030 [Puniceicoccales bacterium]|jgi:hypothetical protein|nr:hypothetical protein [Puniceicoccales bacterium]